MPPFHLLGHETATLAAVVVAITTFLVAQVPRQEAPVHTVVRVGVVVPSFLGLWFGVTLLWTVQQACSLAGTAAFFWVTTLPLAVLGTGLGLLLRPYSRWVRWTLPVFFILLDVGVGAGQAIQGVRIHDLFLGDLLAFDQRATMELPRVHLYSRAWVTLLGGAFVVAAQAGWDARSVTRRAAGLLLGGVLVSGWVGGSHLGLGWGTAARDQVLPALYETEHFRFHYDPNGSVPPLLGTIGREAEDQMELLGAWLTLEDVPTIDVMLYENDAALTEFTRMRSAHAGYRYMHVRWWDVLDETFPHELVHTLHAELSWNPRLLVSSGMLEGTAMAWSDGFGRERQAHAPLAAALEAGHLPEASVFMAPFGFMTVNESNAYRFAGSFLGFLVLEYGMEDFIRFQVRFDPAVYGTDWSGLDARWRTFLRTVDVSLEQQAKARDRFDPLRAPGVFDRQCPKLGVLHPSIATQAKSAYDKRFYAVAVTLYRQALDADPNNRRLQLGLAAAQQRAGRPSAALETLEDVSAASKDRELQKLNSQITNYLSLEQWEELYAAFDQRRLLEEPTNERVTLEAWLRDESIRGDLAPLLLASASRSNRARVRSGILKLRDTHANPAWTHLLASRASALARRRGRALRTPAQLVLEDETLEWIKDARLCARNGIELEKAFLVAIDHEDCARAERIRDVVQDVCVVGGSARRARRVSDRLTRACP